MYSVTVTWYGQSGFRLAAGERRVLIDPFLTNRDDRRYPPPASAAEFADVTLVLCTHEHVDHLDLPFLREFCAVNSGARIVLPAPVVEGAVDGRIVNRGGTLVVNNKGLAACVMTDGPPEAEACGVLKINLSALASN